MRGEEELIKIKKRFAKAFLDVLVLRIIKAQPSWGYKIIAKVNEDFGIKIGPGAIYPLLKSLENSGLVESRIESHGGRKRRIYEITTRGSRVIESYKRFLRKQLKTSDIGAASEK